MNTANSKIDIYEIEDIMKKSKNIAQLSSIFTEYLDYSQDDELRGALACLTDNMFILKDKCRALYNAAFGEQTTTAKGSDNNEQNG